MVVKKRKIVVLVIALAVIVLALWALTVIRDTAFAKDTCANIDEEIEAFIEASQGNEVTAIVKTAESDDTKVVIHEREDLGMCVAFFEKKLSGKRLHYLGMNMLADSGLHISWDVRENGKEGHVVVYGDNRSGSVGAYVSEEFPWVARENLESDFIIDIYPLDPSEETFPIDNLLYQYTPDGEQFHP